MVQVSEPPQRSRKREITVAVGDALVASVPFADGALAVAYVKAVSASYERRQQQWARDVTAALADLSDRVGGLSLESLAQNDTFLDALAHASRIAVSTGQQEKLDALRNAVLNAALPSGDIDADTQAIFLRHIGDLTPSHLHMLKLLVDVSSSDRSTDDMVLLHQHRAKFQTAQARGFYEQLDRDLSAAGLIYQGIIWDALRRAGEHPPEVMPTSTGLAFLRFITDPRGNFETDGGPHP